LLCIYDYHILEIGGFNSRQFIDAAISLESLSNEAPSDISYKICMRTALLLGFLGQNRVEVSEAMRDLYNIRNDIVHGKALKSPTLEDTSKLLEYAKKSLQCCYTLTDNRRDQSKKQFKENLLREIDYALLDHDKYKQITKK
jgi:hypothetical protein